LAQIGHGRPEIADAVAEQMKELEAYSIFTEIATPPARDLAQRLSDLAPMDDTKVFLTSGGGDAIETAMKIARMYWEIQGETQRHHLIGRLNGYHGSWGFGTSVGGIGPNKAGFGPLMNETAHVEHDSVDDLERIIGELGAQNVAAFVFEPVMGAGGVLLPPEGYIESVTELCQSLGVLVVVDAVICGFGRLGTWFGVERFGIEPDMITFAKGVTSGYLPVGGVAVSGRVAEPFWSEPGRAFLRHGPTYAGHAACCVAGLVNIDILEREGIVGRGQELEGVLHEALRPLEDHALVKEVRGGLGLLGAVQLHDAVVEAVPGASLLLGAYAREAGIVLRPFLSGVPLAPPLIITPDEIKLSAAMVGEALDTFERTHADALSSAVAS
jgi:adenosylmethionine-8-amino-7-oxononanoate aminotransferase